MCSFSSGAHRDSGGGSSRPLGHQGEAAPLGRQPWACCNNVLRVQDIDHSRWVLTDEAKGYLAAGTPEAQVFALVPPEGITMAAIKVRVDNSAIHSTCALPQATAAGLLHTRGAWACARGSPGGAQAALPGDVADVGIRQAMQARWVATEKGPEVKVVRKVRSSSGRQAPRLTVGNISQGHGRRGCSASARWSGGCAPSSSGAAAAMPSWAGDGERPRGQVQVARRWCTCQAQPP